MSTPQPAHEVKCYFCQDGKKVGRYECPFCGEWLTPPEHAEPEEPEDRGDG